MATPDRLRLWARSPGRRPPDTRVVFDERAHRAYEAVRRQVAEGRQAYVIYPLVEESEEIDAQAADVLDVQEGDIVWSVAR